MHRFPRTLAMLLMAAPIASTCAAAADCHVDRFQGATLPQGAETRMTVVNRGTACSIALYGVIGTPNENPAYFGEIGEMPQHGTAAFDAPRASYTPAPDFVGDDSFAFSAIAKDRAGRSVRMRVKVNVTVLAP